MQQGNHIGRALIQVKKKRNREARRASINLPFHERVQVRRNSTTSLDDTQSDDSRDNALAYAYQERITLPHEIIEKCQVAFSRFDLNGDGTIDEHELTKALLTLGYNPSEQEVAEIMHDVDQNGDNALDLLEFLRVVQRQKQKQLKLSEKEKNEIDIRECFQRLSDGTGKMKVENFRKALKQFNLALDVESLVSALDIDRSGFVDFEEFHVLFSDHDAETDKISQMN